MDFDPNSVYGENRSPGALKIIAFIIITSLLLLNAIAIFVNADATREEACWTRAIAIGQGFSGNPNATNASSLAQAVSECEKEFRNDPKKTRGVSA